MTLNKVFFDKFPNAKLKGEK
uniref:Uncharacterized protein n=1 Tax=Arundo donax TaxID=35708 RepID=A0A0A9CDN7_ARUDO